MPFTLSHPAAVLLFRGTRLPVAAMVAGSMAPDAPMFVRVSGGYGVTHSLLGVVTVDVVLSALAVAVWFGLVRDALVDVAPAAVRERLEPHARYTARQWALAPPAAILGAVSHVVWDAFTHQHRWGVAHLAWLREQHGGRAGYQWAQYVTGGLGLVVAAVWAVTSLRGLARSTRSAQVPELGAKALATVLLATTLIGTAAGLTGVPDGLHSVAMRAAVLGTLALGVGLLALAATWWLLGLRGPSGRAPDRSRVRPRAR